MVEVKQIQLVPGGSDNKTDCMACSAYWPNGEAVFKCRHEGEWDVHKCEHCGFCDAFRAITDEDVTSWMKLDLEEGRIRKTTFNRYRWVDPIQKHGGSTE